MLPIGILTTTGRLRSTNDESDRTVIECAAWRRSRRGTSRLGEFMAQVETSRVRLKYLGRGFLTLVFMIGTLAGIAGGFVALLAFRLTSGAD